MLQLWNSHITNIQAFPLCVVTAQEKRRFKSVYNSSPFWCWLLLQSSHCRLHSRYILLFYFNQIPARTQDEPLWNWHVTEVTEELVGRDLAKHFFLWSCCGTSVHVLANATSLQLPPLFFFFFCSKRPSIRVADFHTHEEMQRFASQKGEIMIVRQPEW